MSMIDDPSEQPSGSTVRAESPQPPRLARFHRARQVIAVVAALVVVALFASVFAAQSQKRTPGGAPTSTAHTQTIGVTPTATPLPSGFHAVGKLQHLSGYPVVAPSNPQTVYLLTATQLQRSNDDGAHWVTLPAAKAFPSGMNVSWLDLFVSPLTDSTVYATAELSNPDNSQVTNCPAPLPMGSIGAKIRLSGVVPCEVQVVSTNGGASWGLLRMPINRLLGSATANMGTTNIFNIYSATPQAQGNTLYSMATLGPAVGNVPERLVSSADGVTWHTADDGLNAQGLSVCQFAVSPVGHTIFALTAASCDLISYAPQQLWRSDNASNSWTQITLPPGRTVVAMVSASSGGSLPLLYLADPVLNNQPHTFSANILPTDFTVSSDGGQTWHSTPSAGIPSDFQSGSSAITVLSDGGLAAAFQSAPDVDFYAWRPGSASWTMIGSNDATVGVASLNVVGPLGHTTLWATVADGQSAAGMTYTVLALS